MSQPILPRAVTSVLVEANADSVTVTGGLGDRVVIDDPEFFGYGIYYYDPTGNGGKRFGVRFGDATSAWVFDHASATQANYEADSVTVMTDSIVARYHDASLGLDEIGTITAYAHVNGDDLQDNLPVTLLR